MRVLAMQLLRRADRVIWQRRVANIDEKNIGMPDYVARWRSSSPVEHTCQAPKEIFATPISKSWEPGKSPLKSCSTSTMESVLAKEGAQNPSCSDLLSD